MTGRNERDLLIEILVGDGEVSIEQVAIEMACIDDLLKIQEAHSIINSISRTKSGRVRKGTTFANLFENRIEYTVQQINQGVKNYVE